MTFRNHYARIQRQETVTSTNALLLEDTTAPHLSLLIANEQTAGRGRLGRSWHSPPNTQLIFSLLLEVPAYHIDHLGTLPLAAGLAVSDVIDPATLKWPNDVLIDGRKLCGILAEARPGEEGAFRVVLGVGINHLLTREQLPVPHATSLALEGIEISRADLEEAVLTSLATRIQQWLAAEPALLRDYRAACSSIGQQVRLEAPTGTITGVVDDVADDGRILINGTAYSAGDVTHLRPAGQPD